MINSVSFMGKIPTTRTINITKGGYFPGSTPIEGLQNVAKKGAQETGIIPKEVADAIKPYNVIEEEARILEEKLKKEALKNSTVSPEFPPIPYN